MSKEYFEFSDFILQQMDIVPNIIDEDWLNESLKNTYFRIWGLSFSDLSNKRFDNNISNDVLRKIAFSTKTVFPNDIKLLNDNIFKINDDFKKLHDDNINGETVNVAVIDYGFKNVHNEIKHNLIKYYKTSDSSGFHGSVVSSIFVGKNIGVSPKARLYFFEVPEVENQIEHTINALKKIYELNLNGENIRIVNISASIHRKSNEFEEIFLKLKKQGCYVIDSIIFGNNFTTINKDCNTLEYYYSDWQSKEHNKMIGVYTPTKMLPLVETQDDYIYCGQLSYSWAIPVISGLFALLLQINPNATYEDFITLAQQTKIINENGFIILNPIKIIKKALDI